jgi:hypothetical protein
MSFIRTKTIKGKQYLYRQTNVRVGKKVRSIMEYMGTTSGCAPGGVTDRRDRALATAERMAKEIDAYQRATFGETGDERASREAKEKQFDQDKFLEETQTPDAKESPQGEG